MKQQKEKIDIERLDLAVRVNKAHSCTNHDCFTCQMGRDLFDNDERDSNEAIKSSTDLVLSFGEGIPLQFLFDKQFLRGFMAAKVYYSEKATGELKISLTKNGVKSSEMGVN